MEENQKDNFETEAAKPTEDIIPDKIVEKIVEQEDTPIKLTENKQEINQVRQVFLSKIGPYKLLHKG